jgi:hypothetical protein
MEMPPDLLISNITPTTDMFLVVLGHYNFQVCKGFNAPVVALPRGWFADYKYFYPFSTARRCEFVITRVAPASLGSVDLDPAATRAAQASANYEMNCLVVTDLARDSWARERFKIANDGVYQIAQHRFRARDFIAQKEYRKYFRDLPLATDTRAIADFCRPPRDDAAPRLQPLMPMAANPHEWECKSPEEQAAILYQWEHLWQHHTPAAEPMLSRAEGEAVITANSGSTVVPDADWKGRPTAEQLESLRTDDWKKY